MVNSNRLETYRSSSGGQKRRLAPVSSHSGTGQNCPLGVERPSNITQPFDLSTPDRVFWCFDGWLFVHSSSRMIYRELQIFTFFCPLHGHLHSHFWLNLYFPAVFHSHVDIVLSINSQQKMGGSSLLYEIHMIIVTEALLLTDITALG